MATKYLGPTTRQQKLVWWRVFNKATCTAIRVGGAIRMQVRSCVCSRTAGRSRAQLGTAGPAGPEGASPRSPFSTAAQRPPGRVLLDTGSSSVSPAVLSSFHRPNRALRSPGLGSPAAALESPRPGLRSPSALRKPARPLRVR